MCCLNSHTAYTPTANAAKHKLQTQTEKLIKFSKSTSEFRLGRKYNAELRPTAIANGVVVYILFIPEYEYT